MEIDGFTGILKLLADTASHLTDDIFGTYTFVAENNCGRDYYYYYYFMDNNMYIHTYVQTD